MAYLYIVRCTDGSLYTGIAADIEKRMRQHAAGGRTAAKYTRAHPIVEIASLWLVPDLQAAARLEYAVKRLSRESKLRLLDTPDLLGHAPYAPRGEEIPCRHLSGVTLAACLTGLSEEHRIY